MLKKLVCVILSAVLGLGLLTGCSLFTYDGNRDALQVVAKISSFTITNDSGSGPAEYVAPEKKIYKYDLVNALNTSGSQLVQSGYTLEAAADYLLSQLVTRELILSEADAQISFGAIVWGTYEDNQVKQSVYDVIDNQLRTIRNDVLDEHGEETSGADSSQYTDPSSSSVSGTYPTQTEETEGLYDKMRHEELVDLAAERMGEENRQVLDSYSDEKLRAVLEKLDLENVDPWEPDIMSYPGLSGTPEQRSLDVEAMNRFMSLLYDSVNSDYRIGSADRKTYLAELDELTKTGKEKGVGYIYPLLGDTKLMDYMVGDSYRENVKISLLEEHVTGIVDVTEEQIQEEYNNVLSQQMTKYASVDSFASDITSNSVDPLIYYPNGNYYYVKHILVPFSDAQTAALNDFKAGKTLGRTPSDDEIADYKQKLGKAVTGYEHRDGEDYGQPLTIKEIVTDIRNEMERAKASLKDMERTFDKLIYKYNTDDGIFGNEKGYAVKAVFGAGETYDTTYMPEFSKAADRLYRAGVKGAIEGADPNDLDSLVVTDYGVHILYLANVFPDAGATLGLDDYISPGEYTTVREKIAESLRTTLTEQVFTVWQSTRIGRYLTVDNVVERYPDAYRSIIEQ